MLWTKTWQRAFSIWIYSHFYVCIYIYQHSALKNCFSESGFFSKNLHYKIFQRFHFEKAETAPCKVGYVQMSTLRMKEAFRILLQMHFTVVSKDNGFVVTSAELKINYTRWALTACFIQSSNEAQILYNSKGNKVRLLREGQSHRKAEISCSVTAQMWHGK